MDESPNDLSVEELDGAVFDVSDNPSVDDEDAEPTPATRRDELAQAILDGGGRLSDVYQLRVLDGKAPQQVASELGVDTPGFVGNYVAYVNLILDGAIPTSQAYLSQAAAAARGLRRKSATTLSSPALQLLDRHIQAAEQALSTSTHATSSGTSLGSAGLPSAPTASGDPIAAAYATGTVDLAKPGVYAFSIGRYRVDQGNSIIKVGMAVDIGARMAAHKSSAKTVMPDPIELLRAWETPNYKQAEKTLHKILELAGQRYRQPGTGHEWFETR